MQERPPQEMRNGTVIDDTTNAIRQANGKGSLTFFNDSLRASERVWARDRNTYQYPRCSEGEMEKRTIAAERGTVACRCFQQLC
jgi:hypothetical protein